MTSAVTNNIGENKISPAAETITSNTRLIIGPNRSALAVVSEEVDALNWGPTSAAKGLLPKSDLLLTLRTEGNSLTTGGGSIYSATTNVAIRSSCKCSRKVSFTLGAMLPLGAAKLR